MRCRTSGYLIAAMLVMATPGWGQTTTTTDTTTTTATTTTGPTTTTATTTGDFQKLSPGNQKIANALFSAQNTTGTTLTPLTKDQIAELKATEGWGKVFQQMKSEGLLQARNLGQVVSGYEHTLHSTGRTG